ncbi:MAG: 3-phosphoshikimate 1-carboxyvinyltransferase [Lachnospiraceae bacterium]|nr:3-phosphoshikimate 1-carboxyvinyltransferase [Lachnospiraceae bacterium]
MTAKNIPYLGIRSNNPSLFQVSVPGSKSITNRALLLATLADGTSTLKGVLFSDDSRHFLKCIQDLGFHTTVDEEAKVVTIEGLGGAIPKEEASIYVGSAGTAARFLTAYLGLSKGTWHLDASAQMRRRPMAPLLNALQDLGCKVQYEGEEGFFPFTLISPGFTSFKATVNIDKSSQFLSALMIAAVLSPQDFEITLEGTHGMAYVDMTKRMIEDFGVKVDMEPTQEGSFHILVPAGQKLHALDYQIEPDISGACYFYAAAALTGLTIQVQDVSLDALQGDIRLLSLLESMGCLLVEVPEGVILKGPAGGTLKGVNVDMSTFSDQAITLAAMAPFFSSPTTITGIGHIRLQESDRIHAIVTELTKLGITCEEGADYITIHPGAPVPCTIDTYEDHRVAMGFSLVGLLTDGIVINNPECCSKTFENYFQVLDELANAVKTSDKFNRP